MSLKCPKCRFENPDDTIFCGTCAAPLKPSDEALVTKSEINTAPQIAKTIDGKYRILGELGRGGMGTVYKAIDIRLKRPVALKFLPPELTRDKEAKERFVQEAQAASALDHPNICTIYEIDDTEDNHMFISMACYDGESLKEKLDKRPFGVEEIINIGSQIAEGLSKVHKQGIIHRDIKPANIMITEDGVVKIVDFGLAKLSGQVRLTRTGTTLGTVAYMSPEQLMGEEADHRTDVWSLGVVLYEMLTGQLPFKGDQIQAVMHSILNTEPKPLSSFRSDIPYHIEEAISRILEKDKKRRFQKVDEVISALRAKKAEFQPTEDMTSQRRFEKEKHVNQKRKQYIYLSAGAILVVIMIVGGFYLFTDKHEVIDSIAVLPFENPNKDPEIEYLCDGITESLINELAQLPSLKKVIARSSVFHYKEKTINPMLVGQELGVDAVLISWLSQHKDELSLSVELVNTSDNRHIWGNQYRRKVAEILDVQKEISKSILDSLRLRLSGEDLERLTKRYTENTKAYQAYLRGRMFWNKRTKEGMKKAIEHFREAIKEDSNYALAYVGIADAYDILSETDSSAIPKAKSAILTALEIDKFLVEAYATLAGQKFHFDWDWAGAEKDYKRALELNPNYATTHHWYSEYLMTQQRVEESIREMKQALELDPLSLAINRDLGEVLYYARHYDQAIKALKKTLEMNPDFILTHQWLGLAYLGKQMYGEALSEFQKELDLTGNEEVTPLIGIVYVQIGKRDKAEQLLEKLKNSSLPNVLYHIALLYFFLGESDSGFEWLDKAFDANAQWLHFIKADPLVDSIRSDPRFDTMLKKMGLHDE